MPFALGLDFGTQSARALVIDADTGAEIASAASDYAHGVITGKSGEARQHPLDYERALEVCARAALDEAERTAKTTGFARAEVVAIGIDATGSTPLPLDSRGAPLCGEESARDATDLSTLAWLWKDRTSYAEADEIVARVNAAGLPCLLRCGGRYSPEWFWAKALRFARTAPKSVLDRAAAWVELSDYIPALLTGVTDPARIARNTCAAGHKGMYSDEWDGPPPRDFLHTLHPQLARFHDSYMRPATAVGSRVGTLTPLWAERLALPATTAVSSGVLDAHAGAVGAGCSPGTLVKIMGTSTCDCFVLEHDPGAIPGMAGVVPGSILPGLTGVEAGQGAVGDLFDWFADWFKGTPKSGESNTFHSRGERDRVIAELSTRAAELAPGESGLIALDWNAGNRSVLMDPRLRGVLIGQSLATQPHEVFRALIEATAFGALRIIEAVEASGTRVERVVACGGIADKSQLVMQVYADVLGRPISLARSRHACALGSAVLACAAGGAYRSALDAQRAIVKPGDVSYTPDPARQAAYARLYAIYKDLHDAFARGGTLGGVIRTLTQGEICT